MQELALMVHKVAEKESQNLKAVLSMIEIRYSKDIVVDAARPGQGGDHTPANPHERILPRRTTRMLYVFDSCNGQQGHLRVFTSSRHAVVEASLDPASEGLPYFCFS